MRTASASEISAELDVLFTSGIPFQRGVAPDKIAVTYIASLQGCTAEAIRAGVMKFLRGECESVSDRFIPTPPELARIVRGAVVQTRIPEDHQLPPPRRAWVVGERERMRLKMPMFQAAWGSESRMDALAKANADGFGAMVVLATAWGVPIPPELLSMPEAEAERQWKAGRKAAWAEIEANPPPYLIRERQKQAAMRS